jgi:hypothetical protein
MKHYPILVAGRKAAASVELCWNIAVVSIKIAHRKGKLLKISMHDKCGYINAQYIDNYDTYTAIRFAISTSDFITERYAIKYCVDCIDDISEYINFEANANLVSKELLNTLR